MKAIVIKPRRPLVAALLSLLGGGPIGQLYAGRLLRSTVLALIYLIFPALFAITAISYPIGLEVLVAFFFVYLLMPLAWSVDAFFAARRSRNEPLRWFQRWWVYLFAVLAIWALNVLTTLAVHNFVAEGTVMTGRSMSPALIPGDRILIDRLWSRPSRLKQNDIAVYWSLYDDDSLNCMRVAALPGDIVMIKDERVFVNGNEWQVPGAIIDRDLPLHRGMSSYGPVTIPPLSFFVIGDNRRLSVDSRVVGPIPYSAFHGKACVIYLSAIEGASDSDGTSSDMSRHRDWSRTGMRLD